MFGTGIEQAFWWCALGGTLFFGLRMVAILLGGIDHGADPGAGDGHPGHHGADGPDAAFKLISINSLTGFVMMFGWVGLACYKQFGCGEGLATLGAVAAGGAMMYLTATLFRGAQLLVSHGSQFRLEDAIGRKGKVYERIAADGRGRIQLEVNGQTREIDAVAEDKSEIPSFRTVEVVRIVDPSTVAVKTVA